MSSDNASKPCLNYRAWNGQEPLCGNCGLPVIEHIVDRLLTALHDCVAHAYITDGKAQNCVSCKRNIADTPHEMACPVASAEIAIHAAKEWGKHDL